MAKKRPTWRNACQGKERKIRSRGQKERPFAKYAQGDKKAVILMERSDRRISYFFAFGVHFDKEIKNETLSKNASG